MWIRLSSIGTLGALICALSFCGCDGCGGNGDGGEVNGLETPPAVVHSHPKGPFALLGDHEYHAALFHDESTGEVSILITDGHNQPTSVAEKEINLSMMIDGEQGQYVLSAQQRSDQEVRFTIVDAPLCKAVAGGYASWEGTTKVSGLINGTRYSADVIDEDEGAHEGHDDHEGHNH